MVTDEVIVDFFVVIAQAEMTSGMTKDAKNAVENDTSTIQHPRQSEMRLCRT